MSSAIFRTSLATAVAAGLVAAPPALARGPVFGGTTRDGEAIVLRTDGKAKKLNSAVISWRATCKDGGYWSQGNELTAGKAQPGFNPGSEELLVERNGRGRFSGTQGQAYRTDSGSAAIIVKLTGKLKPKKSSGTLSATVTIFDENATAVDGCDTGTVKWTASRSPGRVFGGKTSQDRPVVVRLNSSRRKVSNLLFSWDTGSCTPDGAYAYAESFTNFPVKAGRFGDAFSQDYDMDGGGKRTFAYDLAGNLRKSKASGSISVRMQDHDAAGAQTLSCNTGAVSWSAATG